jgi:hypothetical protein
MKHDRLSAKSCVKKTMFCILNSFNADPDTDPDVYLDANPTLVSQTNPDPDPGYVGNRS